MEYVDSLILAASLEVLSQRKRRVQRKTKENTRNEAQLYNEMYNCGPLTRCYHCTVAMHPPLCDPIVTATTAASSKDEKSSI